MLRCQFCSALRLRPIQPRSASSAAYHTGTHWPSRQHGRQPSRHIRVLLQDGPASLRSSSWARPFASIARPPVAPEDDLPEPILRPGDEDATRTVNVTPAAEKQLIRIQEKNHDPNLALRILVESGGCHGYSTKIQVADAQKDVAPDDYILRVPAPADTPDSGKGGMLLVDAVTLSLIKGSTLDYATELIGSSFRLVDNPQAGGKGCGCGISWELKI